MPLFRTQAIAEGYTAAHGPDRARALAPALRESFKRRDWAVLEQALRSLTVFLNQRGHKAEGAGPEVLLPGPEESAMHAKKIKAALLVGHKPAEAVERFWTDAEQALEARLGTGGRGLAATAERWRLGPVGACCSVPSDETCSSRPSPAASSHRRRDWRRRRPSSCAATALAARGRRRGRLRGSSRLRGRIQQGRRVLALAAAAAAVLGGRRRRRPPGAAGHVARAVVDISCRAAFRAAAAVLSFG